jgi:hypothetical protein
MARAYLSSWGTRFVKPYGVDETARRLRKRIHTEHLELDGMSGGPHRTSQLPVRTTVRRVSSSHGRNSLDNQCLEDVVGDPPFTLNYPCTNTRNRQGKAKWRFL